jgi:4-aminobutyrate aminotransferase-like enzyme
VGDPGENGGWVPHLHFQVITDLLGLGGPFPGVALADQWPVWSSLCPSPRHALGLPAHLVDDPLPDDDAVADRHESLLPPSLSTSYSTPLVAVRGHGPWLYDGWARAHLDAVNNVAHVGHQHPDVVAAQRRQAGLVDTNSRYPHPERVRYLGRLAARFPDPLDTVFLVSSGSEANELALRIARTVTGATDTVALEGGYHGNTGTLVDVSPYKHDGPGGTGPPPWVHTLPLPDVYRSEPLADPPTDGPGDFWGAAAAVAALAPTRTDRIAAVIVESMPGVAGQIELPAGYLAALFGAVRTRGGLCIADEVQVGLGRVGTHWWAFERQAVVPDIVTLGKPLGNGYPLGAVVTTRALAEAFAATGMEYFATFGGNPVACAVGNAVLDVIEAEGLLGRAATTGAYLRAALAGLADRHHVIGDVRGAGLFLGVELVTDRDTKPPAAAEAARVADRSRELGVLLSADGRFGNVLKIKPPMVFGEEHADLLVSTLDRVLGERP